MPNTPPEGSADWIEEIDKRVAWWAKLLRVQDWEIEAGFERLCNRDEGNDAAAWNTIDETQKFSRITIIDPDDWADSWTYNKDWETALVHEMIHLLIHPFMPKKGDPRNASAEQAIVCLSNALVALVRHGTEEPHRVQPIKEVDTNPWHSDFLKKEREANE
jgi:hypothetical protein